MLWLPEKQACIRSLETNLKVAMLTISQLFRRWLGTLTTRSSALLLISVSKNRKIMFPKPRKPSFLRLSKVKLWLSRWKSRSNQA